MKLADLLEQRARAVTEMRTLADTADAETRDLSADEEKRFGELKKNITDLDKKIERAQTVAEAERAAPAILHHGRGDGNFETRARDFSVTKAIRAAIGDVSVDAAFEREMSAEVVRRTGRSFEGIAVPDQVFLAEKRTLTVGDDGPAASLYPNVHRADLFIDRLRSALVTGRLGATVLDGLIGTNDIPRQTASSQAQWVGEDGEITETDADFDDVTLAPKTVGAITSYSRRTLINAVPAIEQIVRNDLAQIIARAIDLQAMTGDGNSNRPLGVINQEGVNSLSMSGTPSWAQLLEHIANVETADALSGSIGWALNARAVKIFRQTMKAAGEGEGYLMETPGQLAGYPAAITNALPGHAASPPEPATIIFGDWSSLLVGYWSGLDLLVNPYEGAAYARGRVLIRAMRDCDVQVRHPESFSFSSDLNVL